ncbi:MAG TPA: Dabb family protein, partial [Verrucomicrobiae bacterium]
MNAISSLAALLITASVMLPAVAADKPAGAKQLRHVVSFKFKDGTTPEQVEKVVTEFRALAKKVPGTPGFEYGVNNSPEG